MPGFTHILARAMAEADYRQLLFANFDRAVEGYSLDGAETALLREISPQKFERIVGSMLAHHFVAIRAGRRVLTIPAERTDIIPAPGDIPIRLLPDQAFGTGTHATTRIAIGALEDLLRPGDRVLDLGCGSGILSIAAVKLGAASALGLDISPDAVETARKNIRLNGVEGTARAEAGSLDTLLNHPFGAPDPAFDLVIANILTPVIVEFLKTGVVRTLRPGGLLVVSGILDREMPLLRHALSHSGLKPAGRYRTRTAWLGLVLKPCLPWSAVHGFRGGIQCLSNISTR